MLVWGDRQTGPGPYAAAVARSTRLKCNFQSHNGSLDDLDGFFDPHALAFVTEKATRL